MLVRVGESLPGAAGATDLGGSSNYSSVILEVRCGVGFLDNCISSRVSRSLVSGVKPEQCDHFSSEFVLRPCPSMAVSPTSTLTCPLSLGLLRWDGCRG